MFKTDIKKQMFVFYEKFIQRARTLVPSLKIILKCLLISFSDRVFVVLNFTPGTT